MNRIITLNGSNLTYTDLWNIANKRVTVAIDKEAIIKVKEGRKNLEKLIEKNMPIYGVNTGVGKLQDIVINREQIKELQLNIVRSHSSGAGEPMSEELVRGMIAIRLNTLLKGYSGIRTEVVTLMVELLNKGVYPYVPVFGSVGASGDLAPLAAVAMVMIGEGYVIENEKKIETSKIIRKKNIFPIKLMEKEGLAIINATSLMTSYLGLSLRNYRSILKNAENAASLSFEALHGNIDAIDPLLHKLKPHKGELEVAKSLRKNLSKSKNVITANSVQDPYSLRAVPQVIGAAYEPYYLGVKIFNTEANAFVDNPLIDDNRAISGANFHGQHIAMALDFLALGNNYISGFSERRIEKLLSGANINVNKFLAHEPGISSGFMIAQYTAAALHSYSKVLSHPASSDSIPTSLGQEDFVSMGPNSGNKLMMIINNTAYVIAIEFLSAYRSICMEGTYDLLSPYTKKLFNRIRTIMPVENTEDQPLTPYIELMKKEILT
ncbi:MAG: histidine ammonia-lyase [Candidatus Thermoplasmatota archaeon]|jgi:histidine ammonia-lyase|nr:histidine ammonia-lyase [Candidatus Thermoplasmatota archaeon]MCL5963990.1 histidine ammonia-lyase [Candidatus Thermoplasmatota archaeon]